MWGNLAGRLAQTDINGALEKIGNAVAPRDDDDDEYSDDEEEEYYDDDDDDADDGGEYDEADETEVKSPFGFVGMLTRALDDNGREDMDDEVQRHHSNGDVGHQQRSENDNQGKHNDLGKSVASLSESSSRTVGIDLTQPQKSESHIDPERIIPSTEKSPLRSKEVKPITTTTTTKLPTKPQAQPDDWDGDWETSNMKDQTRDTSVKVPTIETTNKPQVNDYPTSTESLNPTSTTSTAKSKQTIGSARLPTNNEQHKRTSRKGKTLDASTAANTVTNSVGSTSNKLSTTARPGNTSDAVSNKSVYHQHSNKSNELDPSKYIQYSKATFTLGHKDTKSQGPQPAYDGDERTGPTHVVATVHNVESKNKTLALTKDRASASGQNDLSNGSHRDGSGHALDNSLPVGVSSKPTDLALQPRNDEIPVFAASNRSVQEAKTGAKDIEMEQKLMVLQQQVEDLRKTSKAGEEEIFSLRHQMQKEQEKANKAKEEMLIKFQEKEYRLLQATSEESKAELDQYKKLLGDTEARADRAEQQLKVALMKHENELAQSQQREKRATQKSDDRAAQSMAMLDERNEEISHLKKLIRDMESKVNEHQEGAEEAEEEVEELHEENESLRKTIERLENEKERLKTRLGSVEGDSDRLAEVQLELTLVKEERDRERSKNQSMVDSAITSHSQVEAERDGALSELQSTKQQLDATLADLEVARADASRIMTANTNLQSALEAFQDERQTEMSLMDEQRLESEEAIKAANATALAALKQTHERELFEMKKAADDAVRNSMSEMELLEGKQEKLLSENNMLRRSLDEAISQLQTSQEDVIDRDVMKNILLDWCTLKDKVKRQQVLQVMANLLHFNDEEREKVHLTGLDLDSVGSRFVETLAPRRSTTADVEHLQGENVREKFFDFLMKETDSTDAL